MDNISNAIGATGSISNNCTSGYMSVCAPKWNYCARCGTKLEQHFNYCPSCGGSIGLLGAPINVPCVWPTVWPTTPTIPYYGGLVGEQTQFTSGTQQALGLAQQTFSAQQANLGAQNFT